MIDGTLAAVRPFIAGVRQEEEAGRFAGAAETGRRPAVVAGLLDLGIEAQWSTPEEIYGRLKSDIDKWGKVIEQAGIQKQ